MTQFYAYLNKVKKAGSLLWRVIGVKDLDDRNKDYNDIGMLLLIIGGFYVLLCFGYFIECISIELFSYNISLAWNTFKIFFTLKVCKILLKAYYFCYTII